MDSAVQFYVDVVGLKLKLRDANRWVAFDVGGGTLALEGTAGSERPLGGTAGRDRTSEGRTGPERALEGSAAPELGAGTPRSSESAAGATVSLRVDGLAALVEDLRAKGASI